MIRSILRDQKFRASLCSTPHLRRSISLRSGSASCYESLCNSTGRPLTTTTTSALPFSRFACHEKERLRYRWFSSIPDPAETGNDVAKSLAVDGSNETKPRPEWNKTVWELNDYYMNTHGTTVTSFLKSYSISDPKGMTLWTSEFTCPKTKTVYRSGIRCYSREELDIHRDARVFERVYKGKKTIFYRKKTASLQAAAARALDSIRFEKDGSLDPRFCVEHPAEDNAIAIVSSNDALKLVAANLTEFYKSEYGCETRVLDLIEGETESVPGRGTGWTAQFTCPVSQRVFRSGTFRSMVEPLTFNDKKKRVYYQKKHAAAQAAAARALDVLRFEKYGTLEPRICDEDPLDEALSSDDEEEEQVKIENSDETLEIDIDSEDEEEEEMKFVEPVILEDVEQTIQQQHDLQSGVGSNLFPPQDTLEEYFLDGEEHEEKILVYQPPSLHTTESPAMRILASLSESITSTGSLAASVSTSDLASDKATGEFPGYLCAGSSLVESETERVRRAVTEINAWLAIVSDIDKRNRSHGMQFPRAPSSQELVIAKTLLSSLAEANLACLSPRSTQAEATRILDFLWSTEEARPDADVYNIYLKCLEGSDPITRAIKAESIVERMKHKESLNFPSANTGTFNALLSIWAQVGGVNGRYRKLDESFEPNRESFLAVLSSSSYTNPGIFDTDFAKECIETMQSLYSETGDATLKPDVQVFNAPLRWSGGLLWKKTRPNTRRIEWDDLRRLYGVGFKLELVGRDPIVVNAERIEEWVHGMADFGVSPDIESYEALVQAWVRTGTRTGLEKAEAVIEAIPPHIAVRVQTLHPILAAWLHSKDIDGPSKILKWLDFLRTANEASKASLELDLRFLCLEIVANILQQDFLNTTSSVDETETTTPLSGEGSVDKTEMTSPLSGEVDVWELPKRCSVLFDKLTTQVKEQNGILLPLLAGPAMLTIISWGRIASRPGTSLEACHTALNAMFDVTDMYESLLRDIAKTEAESQKSEVCAAVLSDKTRKAVADSRQVYHCLVAQMHHILQSQLDMELKLPAERKRGKRKLKAGHRSDVLEPYLYQLERITRRLAEFDRVRTSSRPIEIDPSLVFADRYDYQFSAAISISSAVDASTFPWKMLEILDHTSFDEFHYSDVARLCFLLREVVPKTGEGYFADSSRYILNRVLPCAQHRGESFDLQLALGDTSEEGGIENAGDATSESGHLEKDGGLTFENLHTKVKGGEIAQHESKAGGDISENLHINNDWRIKTEHTKVTGGEIAQLENTTGGEIVQHENKVGGDISENLHMKSDWRIKSDDGGNSRHSSSPQPRTRRKKEEKRTGGKRKKEGRR